MIYYTIVAAFILGSAVGWALTWGWHADMREENKRLIAFLKNMEQKSKKRKTPEGA